MLGYGHWSILVNTGHWILVVLYWSLDTGKEVTQTPPLPLPQGPDPGAAAGPQPNKTYFSIRRVQKKHSRVVILEPGACRD